MEIWVIDDGSKDDTWYWIQRSKNDFGETITVVKQSENRGKRQALYKGFTVGNGEEFVTIDSDSIIETDTLHNLVSPFVNDPKRGGVAGNVKVLNKKRGIIPKMLSVRFVFSFEFIRSAQSSLGLVLCTPVALSAYRKGIVPHVFVRWINQRFVEKTATIGEDIAMTNMILKEGYNVVFQKNENV